MKKYSKLVLAITLTFIISSIVLFKYFSSESFFKGVEIESNFELEKNEIELFNLKSLNQIKPIKLIKSEVRNQIKLFKIDEYYIYLSQFNSIENFKMDSIFILNKKNISKTSFNKYYNYKINSDELSLNIQKLNEISSLYIIGNFHKIKKEKLNENLVVLKGISDNLGIKYNTQNDPFDIIFNTKTLHPVAIVVYKENSKFYLMFITKKYSNSEVDSFDDIEKVILSDKIVNSNI